MTLGHGKALVLQKSHDLTGNCNAAMVSAGTADGDDQLRQLNVYLTDLCEENGELKRRLKNLKENNNQ